MKRKSGRRELSSNRFRIYWLRGLDLNQRPLGYEPNELPDCSTPHLDSSNRSAQGQTTLGGAGLPTSPPTPCGSPS